VTTPIPSIPSEGRVRAFIAFPGDDLLREKLAGLQAELAPRLPKLRLARASECHLTLRFLGSVDPSLLTALEASVRAAAEACPRAVAKVAGLGLFPERGSPRGECAGLFQPLYVRLHPRQKPAARTCHEPQPEGEKGSSQDRKPNGSD
jgi:2'-5' RNA ligase